MRKLMRGSLFAMSVTAFAVITLSGFAPTAEADDVDVRKLEQHAFAADILKEFPKAAYVLIVQSHPGSQAERTVLLTQDVAVDVTAQVEGGTFMLPESRLLEAEASPRISYEGSHCTLEYINARWVLYGDTLENCLNF